MIEASNTDHIAPHSAINMPDLHLQVRLLRTTGTSVGGRASCLSRFLGFLTFSVKLRIMFLQIKVATNEYDRILDIKFKQLTDPN